MKRLIPGEEDEPRDGSGESDAPPAEDVSHCSTSNSRNLASSFATLARSISVRLTCFLSWYWHSASLLALMH